MDDNCGEWEKSIWVWLVGVGRRRWVWLVCGMYGCGNQEVGVVRMYIYIFIYIYNYIYSCGIYMGVASMWLLGGGCG